MLPKGRFLQPFPFQQSQLSRHHTVKFKDNKDLTVHNMTQLCESKVILLQSNKDLLSNTTQGENRLREQGEDPLLRSPRHAPKLNSPTSYALYKLELCQVHVKKEPQTPKN